MTEDFSDQLQNATEEILGLEHRLIEMERLVENIQKQLQLNPFLLTLEEQRRLTEWKDRQDKAVLAIQQGDIGDDPVLAAMVAEGVPYYGAVGGELTYEFVPTSIGTFVTVKHSGTGEVLNLRDGSDF